MTDLQEQGPGKQPPSPTLAAPELKHLHFAPASFDLSVCQPGPLHLSPSLT